MGAADNPLIFATPSSVSFRFLHRGQSGGLPVTLADAGGGAGAWTATVQTQTAAGGATVSAPAAAVVPGPLLLHVDVSSTARQGDTTGFVVLSRGTVTRRIPFWLRVTVPLLAHDRHATLVRPGVYGGNTARRGSRVSCYRYPSNPSPLNISPCLRGPEQVFRFHLARPVANFGAVVVSQARGVHVQPRVVRAGDENRLTGYAGLPLNLNPYLPTFDHLSPAAQRLTVPSSIKSAVGRRTPPSKAVGIPPTRERSGPGKPTPTRCLCDTSVGSCLPSLPGRRSASRSACPARTRPPARLLRRHLKQRRG